MNRIEELRKSSKMTQAELADAIPTSRQSIGKWENGDIDLSTANIARLCEIFACTSDYLLGFSIQRTARISDADAAILDAYHAADDHTRQLVDLALRPFLSMETSSASPADAG